jgi:hypothetical protein
MNAHTSAMMVAWLHVATVAFPGIAIASSDVQRSMPLLSEEIILRARTFFASALTAGCDQLLNEIAVSDRGTLRGLTQFCRRRFLPRFKPPMQTRSRNGSGSRRRVR